MKGVTDWHGVRSDLCQSDARSTPPSIADHRHQDLRSRCHCPPDRPGNFRAPHPGPIGDGNLHGPQSAPGGLDLHLDVPAVIRIHQPESLAGRPGQGPERPEVGEASAIEQIDEEDGQSIPPADMRGKSASLALPQHPAADDQIGLSHQQRFEKTGQIRRVIAEVGIQKDNDVRWIGGKLPESGLAGAAVPAPWLLDHPGASGCGDSRRSVPGAVIHHHHLVPGRGRKSGQDQGQGLFLIQSRYDHGNPGLLGGGKHEKEPLSYTSPYPGTQGLTVSNQSPLMDRSSAPSAPGGMPGLALLQALRPEQWVKNLVVLAALLFGQRLTDQGSVLRGFLALAIFCGLSGCVYLLNDLRDMERDRLHPAKRHRPLAAGRLAPLTAWIAAFILGAGGLALSFLLPPGFSWCAAGYLALNLAYSFGLKNIVILDLLAVAGGFVLRAVAGAEAIPVSFSNWLVLCTLLLALFMVAGKRRHELILLEAEAAGHRASLEDYSIAFLDHLITVVLAATVVGYSLYALSPEVAGRLHTRAMPWTVPFVLYGIFRYLYLIHHRKEGGNPTRILFTDRPLLVAVVLWVAAVAVILYLP